MRRRLRTAAFPIHRHALPQLALDAGLVALAYYLAYRWRFDGGIPDRYFDLFTSTLAFAVVGSLVCFTAVGMYRHWMRYSSQREYIKIAEGVVLAVLSLVGYVAVVQPQLISTGAGFVSITIPTGVLMLFGLLTGAMLAGTRYLVHFVYERPLSGFRSSRNARSVLIVGAGDGGRLLLRELTKNPELNYRPVGFVDDDPRKKNMSVDRGLRVLGTTEELSEVLEDVEPDEVLIAVPSAPGTMRARVVTACRERGVPVRTMPTVFELLQTGGRLSRQLREVRVEDVLGRDPIRMEIESVGGYLTGRSVMVTGAGGSIGSELCRQIARVNPSRLVLVDNGEANLFAIERELIDERHVQSSVSVLADCKDEERMRDVFREHRPEVVFHAAAYKHVALMEDNPIEAVRNNALATRTLTAIAGEYRTRTFVLGSSGSVVPIFRRQIAAGGPVTVTDPEMTRFFMTIPEAVQLVIRSGSLAQGGEVYALEMGEPVRIMDLAVQMIEFSGLKPHKDIAIDIIGPRPGEKLHEQLFNAYERPEPTPAQKIRRAARPGVDPAWVEYVFDKIGLLVAAGDAAGLAAAVTELSGGRTAVVETSAEPSSGTAS